MTDQFSLAMTLIADLAIALDEVPMNKHENCWEHRVDNVWEIAVNGHREPKKCSFGRMVPPFECYIQFNGWPAGIINPYGGSFAAGTVANEDAFIAALRAALAKVKS